MKQTFWRGYPALYHFILLYFIDLAGKIIGIIGREKQRAKCWHNNHPACLSAIDKPLRRPSPFRARRSGALLQHLIAIPSSFLKTKSTNFLAAA